MNFLEWRHLQAEKRALDDTLGKLSPQASNALRQPLEHRRERIMTRLAADPGWESGSAVGLVSLSGGPVHGNYGIDIDFAGQVLQHFGSTIVALSGHQTTPMLTEIVPGSFGFQIESGESQRPLFEGGSHTVAAFESIIGAMAAVHAQHDESAATAFVGFNPSAMASFRRFISTLADNNALCSVEIGANSFQFSNVDRVRQMATLMERRVEESEESWTGQFRGFLPDGLWGEFVPEDSDESLLVRIALEDNTELPGDINELVGHPVTLSLQRRRVGTSRPRYTVTRWQIPHDTEQSGT